MPFICHLLCHNIVITTKYTAQRREVGSSRILPKSLSANSEPHVTGRSTMNSIVTPGVRRGFWAAFLDFNWEAGSWWSVQTPACHDVRDSASVGCVQWCDDSSKSPGELNDPFLYVVIRGLPLFGPSFTSGTTSPSLLTKMWKFRSTPRTRVQNWSGVFTAIAELASLPW